MTRQEVLNEYGKDLTKDEREELFGNTIISANYQGRIVFSDEKGLINSTAASIDYNDPNLEYNIRDEVLTVYHTEWLANNKVEIEDPLDAELSQSKVGYRLDRYQSVRIGETIYTQMGKAPHVVRSHDKPYECSLSINGVSYTDRYGKAYSLALSILPLQDKYNILHYHRDNLIANSGTKGDFLDISMLPTFLGNKPHERIMKWQAYKKQGMALMNSAQAGREGASFNTIFSGYDDTVDPGAIQAIQAAITQTEEITSSITGVYRERLGGIEQRDAVSNVKMGVEQSAIITKQYFSLMDDITKELLTDMLNMAKISYVGGFTSSYVDDAKRMQLFTVNPSYFSFTDYDINISDSQEELKDMETIKQLSIQAMQGQMADLEDVVSMVTSKSLTDMKESIKEEAARKKEENNQLEQLQQQVEEAQKQIQDLSKQNEQLQKDVEQKSKEADRTNLEKSKLALDREKFQSDNEIKEKELDIKEKAMDIEVAELHDNNPFNDKINTNR